jgi:small subunit ribosomal protein S13
MARIAGYIPKNKRGYSTYLHLWISKSRAEILEKPAKPRKVQDWNDDEIGAIRDVSLSKLKENYVLKFKHQTFNGYCCYRGIHRTGLPLRGQRTKNNSRTKR